MSSDDKDDELGKGRPPLGNRFNPGQSGNPKGRPRGKRLQPRPYDIVLGQMVTLRENGEERRLRADEAFLLHLTAKGLAGDGVMARGALSAIRKRPRSSRDGSPPRLVVYGVYADAGDLKYAVTTLRIAVLLDPYRPSARLVLEDWVVEASLERLGDRQLTVDEQKIVVAAARSPHKIHWPAWWTVGLAPDG